MPAVGRLWPSDDDDDDDDDDDVVVHVGHRVDWVSHLLVIRL